MRVLCAAVLALLVPAAASATPEQDPVRDCFLSNSWRGWSVPREGDVLYLRVRINDIYRVELSPGSRARRHAGEFLVNQVRGSSRICSALDLDLSIADDNGFARPLIATGLRKLTPEEVAALPREDIPY